MAALMPQGKQQYFTAGGIPLVGGKVYTYAAGTTTPLATYTTAAASTPNANPVILDSRGEASIFFSAANYKIVVKDSLDSTIWTQDNLPGDQAATILANLAASSGSSLVGHIASVSGAVATTLAQVAEEELSFFRFLTAAQIANYTAYTGSIDLTSQLNAAISVSKILKQKLRLPDGALLITGSINFPVGARVVGGLTTQYANGFSISPGGTTINFSPATPSTDLFVANGTAYGGFRFHQSVSGVYIVGNANARYAFNLDHTIYASFENIAVDITTFAATFYCNGTINNRFENVYTGGTTAGVIYAGDNETTDVWDQCSFWGSPIGVDFLGSSIAIRFSNCLYEQLDTYGMRIAKDCQNIQVANAYCEDVPFVNTATNAMFKIGHTGTTLPASQQLTITGGKFSGRNAGTVGTFLDCDYCNGVTLVGVTHDRYTNIIKTTANTAVQSIRIQGGSGLGWTTYANDYTKLSGSYPNGVNNIGTPSLEARYLNVNTNSITAADGNGSSMSLSGAAIVLAPGVANAVYPLSDGAINLGISSNRWSTVYATTGAINTSDETQKQQIKPIDPLALKAWAKVEYCQFKFNDAVAVKGNGARWHFGVIAQRVKDAFESEGLDPFEYGLLCYDEWPDKFDDDGILVTAAGNSFGIRYEEALSLECAYLRSKCQ